jgi:DNA-directed RNA polymerase specialized sigma24 family protein
VSKQQNEFVSVVQKEQPKLLRYVRQKLTGISDMDAEDIVADVLFNVYNRMATANQVENLAAYLYQSVKHKIWDHFRQAKTPLSLDALDKDTGLTRGENLIDPEDIKPLNVYHLWERLAVTR